MASEKRQQRGSIFEGLLALPWYLNAGIAVVVYFPIKYLPVFIQPQSPTASAAVAVASDLSVFIALIPFAAAIISGVRSITAGDSEPLEMTAAPAREVDETVQDDVEQAQQSEPEVVDSPDEVCHVPETAKLERPESMSLELLRQIEWKRFESLCRAYLEAKGGRAETTKTGPDGGVDIKLFKGKSGKPVGIVQCRAGNSGPVGIELVQNLFEAMAPEGVSAGILMTTGYFAQEAKDFAKGKKLILISGVDLVHSILEMSEEVQQRLLDTATEGDYATPTCPECDTKMELRKSTGGSDTEGFVWCCTGELRCGVTFEYKPEMA